MHKLGSTNIDISNMGLGCMGMSEFYGETDDIKSTKTLEDALAYGVNLFDTADQYGMGHNEELIGRFLQNKRNQIVLSTKFGVKRDLKDPKARIICGHPDYVKEACHASLKRLNTDYIDLYYLHRVDKSIPIEDTIGALADLVKEGKIRAIGLSEASTDTIVRACKIFPISALQTEYSLWSRDVELEILPLCHKMNITFVAYSPLGRGFLTGTINSITELASDDFRRLQPRFSEDNLSRNKIMVDKIKDFAVQKNITPAQLALSWLINQNIVPIPGTKSSARLQENIAAMKISLSETDMIEIRNILLEHSISGNRYNDFGMKLVNL